MDVKLELIFPLLRGHIHRLLGSIWESLPTQNTGMVATEIEVTVVIRLITAVDTDILVHDLDHMITTEELLKAAFHPH